MSSPGDLDPTLAIAAVTSPRFAAAVADADSPLLDLACLVGEGLDELDLPGVRRQIEFLAYLVDQATSGRAEPADRVAALRQVLGREEGFCGSCDDYDAPENSFMRRVLERRRGLPITLCLVYMEVGRVIGWPVLPVDLPGHFLCRYDGPTGATIIDAFAGGEVIGVERCVALARPAYVALGETQLRDAVFERLSRPVTPHAMVARMLRNLELTFVRRQRFPELANVVRKLIVLQPEVAELRRDLGQVLCALGDRLGALRCLRDYLERAPDAADRDAVGDAIQRLAREVGE